MIMGFCPDRLSYHNQRRSKVAVYAHWNVSSALQATAQCDLVRLGGWDPSPSQGELL